MLAVIVAAFTWLPPAAGFRVESMAKIMIFHVPNSIAALAASVASAWYAIRFLRSGSIAQDIRSHCAASLALLFWLLTTVTGAIFAQVQWGAAWNWDPKQSSIFILLLLYCGYFALRASIADRRKQATITAAYTLFAAFTVPFLTFVLPNAPGTQSLHPQGVVFSMNGMDAAYKTVFWSATLGFLSLTVWMFRVSVGLETLRERFERLETVPPEVVTQVA